MQPETLLSRRSFQSGTVGTWTQKKKKHREGEDLRKQNFQCFSPTALLQKGTRLIAFSNLAFARRSRGRRCSGHSRHTDEGHEAAKEEGAVDDLHHEREILKLQHRDGGADGEQQALQRRQEEGEDCGPQVCVSLALACNVAAAGERGRTFIFREQCRRLEQALNVFPFLRGTRRDGSERGTNVSDHLQPAVFPCAGPGSGRSRGRRARHTAA